MGVALILLALLVLNLRLYLPRPPDVTSSEIPGEVRAELRYLRQAIDRGAGERMQYLFPEGDFFLRVLYGLAWVNAGLRTPEESPERLQALAEARRTWEELGDPAVRAPFAASRTLAPEYGVFYAGWRNYLLAGVLLLQPSDSLDPVELAEFRRRCEEIARALEESPTPFLQAYPGQAWPVDTFPALVSLRAHTHLVDDRYEGLIGDWLAALRDRLDPATGLLPHRVRPQTGEIGQGTRATSQVLILRFLLDLDPAWGLESYRLFREDHAVYLWGVPGVLEYPRGTRGYGDVDSGPLIDGASLSATALMIGTARVYGDEEMGNAIWHAGELLGLPLRVGGAKRYAFGLFPVGDAFAVWSKTAVPWFEPVPAAGYERVLPRGWRLRLNLLSLLSGSLLWVGVARLQRLRTTVSPSSPAGRPPEERRRGRDAGPAEPSR